MVSSGVHLLLVLLMVQYWQMGFLGICIATNLMFMVRFCIVLVQIETIAELKNIYGVKLFSKETTENISY